MRAARADALLATERVFFAAANLAVTVLVQLEAKATLHGAATWTAWRRLWAALTRLKHGAATGTAWRRLWAALTRLKHGVATGTAWRRLWAALTFKTRPTPNAVCDMCAHVYKTPNS